MNILQFTELHDLELELTMSFTKHISVAPTGDWGYL